MLNNQLPPYVDQFIYKRKCRSEVQDSMGKIKTNCISCVPRLIWEKLHSFWKIVTFCLMDILAQRFFKVFCLFILQSQTFYCWSLKSFSSHSHFTIMFQKEKRWLHLMWFEMAFSFVLLKSTAVDWVLYRAPQFFSYVFKNTFLFFRKEPFLV